MPVLRAVTYSRVSTLEQAGQDRHSLEAQRDALGRYAAALDYTVVGTYTDPGYSGATIERPDLTRLIEDARSKKFDVVLVYRLDRLARRVQLAYELIEILESCGVAMMSYAEPSINTTTPMGKATLGMMAIFAEWERDTFIERSRLGMRKAVEKGHFSGGVVAYGYEVIEKRLVIHPEEAEVVREVYRLYVGGMNSYTIARELNLRGIPTRYRKSGRAIRGKETAGQWGYAAVLRMLQNRTYLGEITYGRRNGTKTVQATPTLTKGFCPPILTLEVFEAAQRRREGNVLEATRNTKNQYLLRGMVVCGTCGRRYTGMTRPSAGKSGSFYYACSERTARRAQPDAVACPNPYMRGDALEREIWAEVCAALRDPVGALERVRSEQVEPAPRLDTSDLEKRLEAVTVRRSRLLDGYLEGTIAKPDYVERIADLDAQMIALQTRLGEMTSSFARTARAVSAIPLTELAARYAPTLESLDFEERREVVALLLERVLVLPDKSVSLEWRI